MTDDYRARYGDAAELAAQEAAARVCASLTDAQVAQLRAIFATRHQRPRAAA